MESWSTYELIVTCHIAKTATSPHTTKSFLLVFESVFDGVYLSNFIRNLNIEIWLVRIYIWRSTCRCLHFYEWTCTPLLKYLTIINTIHIFTRGEFAMPINEYKYIKTVSLLFHVMVNLKNCFCIAVMQTTTCMISLQTTSNVFVTTYNANRCTFGIK